MISKELKDVTREDIQSLIDNSISEGNQIEYKESYLLSSEKEKGEFLADLSSFANTNGGYIVYGIKEEGGIAKEISGINIDNQDAEKLKIENIIRDGINPRIKIDIRFIEKFENLILIIKVYKSWLSPHRVIYSAYSKNFNQFYARSSAGKYQLDINELRSAFNLSETIIEKINTFKVQRIMDMVGNNFPVELYNGGKIILHIIPLESFNHILSLDIGKIHNPTYYDRIGPIFEHNGLNRKINIDGLFINSGKLGYTQLYRNGILEVVDSYRLSDDALKTRSNGKKEILPDYEIEIIKSLSNYLNFLKEQGVGLPLVIYLTYIGVKGFTIPSGFYSTFEPSLIEKDMLNLPEFLLNDYSEPVENMVRSMFDIVRNACGYFKSKNFDEDGKLIKKDS